MSTPAPFVISHRCAAPRPLVFLHVTTAFEDAGHAATRVTITWAPHDSDPIGLQTFDAARSGMEAGWKGTFAKLDTYLRALQA